MKIIELVYYAYLIYNVQIYSLMYITLYAMIYFSGL